MTNGTMAPSPNVPMGQSRQWPIYKLLQQIP